jgi:ParB/RepB/Spo0J family partition protein
MNTLTTISLDMIRLSQTVSQIERRKRFSGDELAELTESVKKHGVLQPIIIRSQEDPIHGVRATYELVVGERRYLAAKAAGLEEIPAVVREDLDDEQAIEIQLIENLQRADLHPMQEAEGYHELMSKHGHVADELGERVGKSRSYVYARLKLLELSDKCRKAFYAGEISQSIALLLARIPVEKLQAEALRDVLGDKWSGPMSYRTAQEHVQERYMLRLAEAPFPTEDEKLNGSAGPCGACPKRTGNQKELFGDVKSPDVCTDPACFKAKTVAFANRQIQTARDAGREVITGAAAKKIAPNGVAHAYDVRDGYKLADEKFWIGSTHTTPRKLLKPDATTALLQDPETGKVVEIVHESQLKKPKRESGGREESWRKEKRENAARAKVEKSVRRAVFQAIQATGKWQAPSMRVVAELMVETLDYDAGEVLMDLLGVPESKTRGFFDRVRDHVKGLTTEATLENFVAQAYLAGELHVNSYSRSPMTRLEAAAKLAGVDVAKIRRELTPKKKAKAKAKAKAKRKAA